MGSCVDPNSQDVQTMPTAVPFSLVGIDHVVLLVDDMQRALGFYSDVLGCQQGYSYPELGMEQIWCGSALIVLWDVTHPGGRKAASPVPGGRNVDHICIATGPFDHQAMRTHLESHGVEIHQEAFHGGARGMGRSFYIQDPFGNRLEIKGPAEYPDGRASVSS
jgi:glyoxylase I family protein